VLAAPPEKSALVASQVPGVIASIDAREGDSVVQGQVLARVDRATLSDALAQAEAGLQRAVAERANADAALARARLVFEKGISSRQDVDDAAARAASLRAAVTEAEAAVAQAQRQVGRTEVRAPMPGVVVHLLRRPGSSTGRVAPPSRRSPT
jgi:RND family efflux transporter MFP subunit